MVFLAPYSCKVCIYITVDWGFRCRLQNNAFFRRLQWVSTKPLQCSNVHACMSCTYLLHWLVWPCKSCSIETTLMKLKDASKGSPCLSARSASVSAGVAFCAFNAHGLYDSIDYTCMCQITFVVVKSLIETPRNPATSSSTLRSISNSLNLSKVLSISVLVGL